MIGMEFYVAYAIRHFAHSDDIIENLSFKSFRKAAKYANRILCDDDDSAVFVKYKDEWYSVVEKTKGGYKAYREADGWGAKSVIIRG